VKKLVPHHARDVNMTNAARVFDDRRSGRHLDAAKATAAAPESVASALAVVAKWAARAAAAATAAAAQMAAEHAADAAASIADVVVEVGGTVTDAVQAATAAAADAAATVSARTAQRAAARNIPLRLALLARSARIAAAPSAEAAQEAAAIYERLRTIAVVTSDYAAQIETQRKYTGTCASRERHNFLVSVVCYEPYKQIGGQRGSKAARQEPEYKQHVDVFFAFHKAGFKPSARSFNVVQACMLYPLHACAFPPAPPQPLRHLTHCPCPFACLTGRHRPLAQVWQHAAWRMVRGWRAVPWWRPSPSAARGAERARGATS
jgi:hypothetical protein